MTVFQDSIDAPVLVLPRVLFPGGQERLRMAGAQHVDLMRECARGDGAFGISLMLPAGDASRAPASIGTLVRIVDFHSLDDGALAIDVLGVQRYTATLPRVRDSGLVVSRLGLWREPPPRQVPAQYMLLVTILERLAEHDPSLGAAPRERFDDASWVAFRLAESLPLEQAERQYLLQIHDPLERLDQLLHYLPRFAAD